MARGGVQKRASDCHLKLTCVILAVAQCVTTRSCVSQQLECRSLLCGSFSSFRLSAI